MAEEKQHALPTMPETASAAISQALSRLSASGAGPLSAAELEEIVREHRPRSTGRTICLLCEHDWPCTTLRLALEVGVWRAVK